MPTRCFPGRQFSSRRCRKAADGWSASTCARSGLAVVELGGGPKRASDAIDPAVGLTDLAPIGAEVGPDAPLARVHARRPDQAEAAARRLRAAYRLGAAPPARPDPVVARIAPQ